MGSQEPRARRPPRDRLRRARARPLGARADPALRLRRPRRRPAARCSTTAASSARCWPAPRWAPTRSSASRSSTRSASPALVVDHARLRPGRAATAASSAGTRSARGLREGGVDGLRRGLRRAARAGAVPRHGAAPSCASACPRTSTPRRSPTRSSRSRARAPFDVVGRPRPRSTSRSTVVASRDEADPGAPVRDRRALRASDPGRRAASTEEPGKSPLAWQGGQLSRVIAETAARAGIVPEHARHRRRRRWTAAASCS